MEFLALINFYFTVAFIVLVANAVTAGFQGKEININDVIQSAFWPVSVSQMIGTLIRIAYDSYKDEIAKPKVTKKKETK